MLQASVEFTTLEANDLSNKDCITSNKKRRGWRRSERKSFLLNQFKLQHSNLKLRKSVSFPANKVYFIVTN